jgi:FkbM family methyltransferase
MAKWWTKNRFDLVELLLIAATLSFAAWMVGRSSANPELQWLKAQYGPHDNSEHGEEWMVRDFFRDKRNGVFLDVGANHYRKLSNTYYLETQLDWSGVAVEPLRQFEADYVRYRPRTRFMPFFVSDVSNENARLYVLPGSTLVASGDRSLSERAGTAAREVVVPTITLDDLLDGLKLTHVDFVSIDIELYEPKALAGFSINRFEPSLVCVEAHPQVRQQILDYFAAHRYVVVGKYLRADTANLYLTPMSDPVRPPS